MTITSGDCGGFVFREPDTSAYYEAQFCQDGTYELDIYTSDVYDNSNSRAIAGGSSSAILQGLNKSNVIAVVANGNTIELYVNQKKITNIKDSSSSHGSISLFAQDKHGSCEVVYSNAKVWTF